MDRLRSLEVFVEVVDRGGMSRAAAALGMSPTMVTTHLARLEERLGRRLLDRSTRRMDLTREGRMFLDNARHILASFAAAENAARGDPGLVRGRVRIDAPASVGHRILVPAMGEFRAAYPQIMVDLSMGDRGTSFRSEGFDIVVRVGEPHFDRAHVRVLGQTRFVHLAAPSYLARRGTPVTPEDIEQHDAIAYASVARPEGARWDYTAQGQARWLKPRFVLTFNDGDAITAAAVAGLGIARTLDILVRSELSDARLTRLYEDLATEPLTISAVAPIDRHAAPAVTAMLDFLQTLNWSADDPGGQVTAGR
jgi:DNA-binding transcriptional LysR family regulator